MADPIAKIEAWRRERGLSQRELSLKAGLRASTLNMIVNNPDRSQRTATLEKLAEAMGVTMEWLFSDSNAPEPSGFSETALTPYTIPDPGGQRQDLAPARKNLVASLCPDARNPALMMLQKGALGFGLLKGDVIIIDQNRSAREGEVVVAQVADVHSGEAATVLKRLIGHLLIDENALSEEPPLMNDGHRVAIMGPVIASFRAPQLTR